MAKQVWVCKGYFGNAPRTSDALYTTLASTLKNLEKKKYLQAKKLGNSYYYEPLVSGNEYEKAETGN